MSPARSASLLLLPGLLACGLAAQAPQWHRAKIGALEVTALQDGILKLPPTLLKDIAPAETKRLLGNLEPVPTSVNAFLVRTGGHLLLVDTGGSPAMDAALGNILPRLKEAGVRPEAVEAVLITHFHGDHLWGLLGADGQRAFPNAVVRVAKAESDFWLSPTAAATLPAAYGPNLARMRAALAPYQAAGAFRPFAEGEAPFPGVQAIPAPGHTPGHSLYAFGTGREAFWAVGDITHFGRVQFEHPEATVAFDRDSPAAAASRLALWRRAAQEGAVLGAAHLAFPGLGRVQARGGAFAWVPLP